MSNPYGEDVVVDQLIGSAYPVVEKVANNIDGLLLTIEALPTLTNYIPTIESLLENLTAIKDLANNLDSVNILNSSLVMVGTIADKLTELSAIHDSLSTLLGIPAVVRNVDWKPSVKASANSSIRLTGTQVIDGISVSAGDRVLVLGQTNKAQNGIYIVQLSSWVRAVDSKAPYLSTNSLVLVDQGTYHQGKVYRLSTTNNIVDDVTEQVWVEFLPTASNETPGLIRFATDQEFRDHADDVAITARQAKVLHNKAKSIGSGISLVGDDSTSTLNIKSLKAGNNVQLYTTSSGEVIIAATGGGGGSNDGGNIGNIPDVLNAILTDTSGVLMDSNGNVLCTITV